MGRMFLNGEEYGVSSEDVSQSIVEFQSDDALEPKSSINLPLIEGRETIGGFAKKISKVVRNVRYLLHVLGTTDISLKGDGTVTGAIGALSEVAFTGDYRDLSEAPEVGAGTVTIKQGGQLAGSFSVNQNQDAEIDLSVSQGPKGDDGVSVSKIEQVTTSTADGGTNVFRVTLSNGKTADFSVKNGSKGSTGAKGDTGATGATGSAGAAAGFGTPTASVDANVGTPSVTVTASGSNTAKVFNFVFRNLKGAKGDKGDKGDTGARGATGPQGPAGVNATTTAVATQSANGLQSAADKKKLDGIPADTKAQIEALNTGLDDMLSPIVIVFKDYDVRPTVSNSVVDLNYDISDLILPGYVISQIVDVKVLYTDSLRYQQVTITNLSSQSATAKIMCLNTVPFKIRIYALIYRKSAIAN